MRKMRTDKKTSREGRWRRRRKAEKDRRRRQRWNAGMWSWFRWWIQDGKDGEIREDANDFAKQKVNVCKMNVLEKNTNVKQPNRGAKPSQPQSKVDGAEVLTKKAKLAMDRAAETIATMASVAEDVFQLPETVGLGKKLVVSIPIRDLK